MRCLSYLFFEYNSFVLVSFDILDFIWIILLFMLLFKVVVGLCVLDFFGFDICCSVTNRRSRFSAIQCKTGQSMRIDKLAP